jgi:putative DNA methylase
MPRKLIEVALPLEAINAEAAREKSIRHGHPSTLHLWWARRPLAACRAVLFAQMVDDPSAHPELFPTEEAQAEERQRLFGIIERLVKWENANDPVVLEEARAEIRRWCGENPPPVLDPFCGGGSIPLEAQRLGLEAHGSDLNPVAVLITRALIELPPKFAGQRPVRPDPDGSDALRTWTGAQGLAEDVRYYGAWMRDRAEEHIGHLYPKATLPDGSKATVIAWLWARTVSCPNPACRSTMPLVRSFWLGKKKGKEAWVDPIPEPEHKRVRFEIGHGKEGPPVEGTVGRTGASCLVCNEPVPLTYVREEGRAGRLGAQLMAVVAEGHRQRTYLPPTTEHEQAAAIDRPDDVPDTDLPDQALGFRVQAYGMTCHADLFTNRQLTALTTFSHLVTEARTQAIADGAAEPYADALATYLAFGVSKATDFNTTIATWASDPKMEQLRNAFARQAIPMTWDFGEANVFGGSAGTLTGPVDAIARVLDRLAPGARGAVVQRDATFGSGHPEIISTDPPYYDNIGYADLSDFFYVWLRRSLRDVHPDLLGTMLTPKSAELIATPYRFDGDRKAAEVHFESGFNQVFSRIAETHPADYPLSIFYAFKQSESDDEGQASTGWETMLEGLMQAGLAVLGTWPMRTERSARSVGIGTNALASSIVLVCRPRHPEAGVTDRRGFLKQLHDELPNALRHLQEGAIAPVDLAQAAIGPGMAVFSRFAKVVEPDGSAMRVRTALALINQVLDEVLAEQEGEFDPETRFAIAWFEQFGFNPGSAGMADQLARAKNTAVNALDKAGIFTARAGEARLLARDELADDWDPSTDDRIPVWEVTQQLIKRLESSGESGAAELLAQVGGLGDVAKDLAYRLYAICERKKWAKDALAFNSLVTSWLEITRLAHAGRTDPGPSQESML